MKVSIASDHGGLKLKNVVSDYLTACGHMVFDCGTNNDKSVDYADFAKAVVNDILEGKSERGVLICGSGIGMSIAANRFSGIRAALVHSVDYSKLAREHNNANVLVLGGRFTDEETAREICDKFFTIEYAGGRHDIRLEKIEKITEE